MNYFMRAYTTTIIDIVYGKVGKYEVITLVRIM